MSTVVEAQKSMLMMALAGAPRSHAAVKLARFDYIHGKICVTELERRIAFALRDEPLDPEYGDCGCCSRGAAFGRHL